MLALLACCLPAVCARPAAAEPAATSTSAPASPPGDQDALERFVKEDASPLTLRDDSSGSEMWGQMLAAILIILVLGALAVLATRKLAPRISSRGGRKIAVEETTYLGPRKAVHIVRVEGQRFLLGSHKDGVTMLAELKAPAAEEENTE